MSKRKSTAPKKHRRKARKFGAGGLSDEDKLLITQLAAATLTTQPSTDQDPVFDHANGVLVPVTADAVLITPPAGCKYIRVGSDADCLLRTDGSASANDGHSIRIVANQPEIVPVTAATAVHASAVTGTANIRATPLKVRA